MSDLLLEFMLDTPVVVDDVVAYDAVEVRLCIGTAGGAIPESPVLLFSRSNILETGVGSKGSEAVV